MMSHSGGPDFGLASLLLEAAAIIHRREQGLDDTRGPYFKYEDHTATHVVPRSAPRNKRSRAQVRRTFDVDSESNNSDSDGDASPSSAARNKPYRRPAAAAAAGGGSGRKPRGPAQHNEVEKRRRAYLSSCYVELHELVPTIRATKASNVTILQSAAEHITVLESEGTRLGRMVEAERRRRKQLLVQSCLPDSFLRPVETLAAPGGWSGASPTPPSPVPGTTAAAAAVAPSSPVPVSAPSPVPSPSPSLSPGPSPSPSPSPAYGHSADETEPFAEDHEEGSFLVPDEDQQDDEMVPTIEEAQEVVRQSPLKASQLVKVTIVQPDEGGSRRRSSRRPIRFT